MGKLQQATNFVITLFESLITASEGALPLAIEAIAIGGCGFVLLLKARWFNCLRLRRLSFFSVIFLLCALSIRSFSFPRL